jgi:hypothetical protein
MSAVLAARAVAGGTAREGVLVGLRLEAALAVAAVAFVVVGPRAAGWPLAGLVLGGAVVLAVVALRKPDGERRVLAVSGILMLFTAVPINRLTGVSNVLLAMLAASALLTVVAFRPARSNLATPIWPAATLVLVAAFVTAVSPDHDGLIRFAPFLLAFVPLFVLGGQLGGQERERVLRFVVALAVVESLLAVAEQFLGNPQLWAPTQINNFGVAVGLANPFLPHLFRSQGTLGNPLPLGMLIAIAIAALTRGVRCNLVLKLVVGSTLFVGLVFSGNRNSLILAVIVVAYFASRSFRIVRATVATLVLAFVAVLAVAAGALNDAELTEVTASGSFTHRAGSVEAVTRLLTEQPLPQVLLGNGWASSARLFAAGLLQTDGFNAVDNMYVLLLAQGGLVCLVLLGLLLVGAVVRGGPAGRPMMLVIVATLLVFDVFIWPASAALTGLVLAGFASSSRVGDSGKAAIR